MSKLVIKVLVVDDHPVVRDGLRLMLSVSPGLICVGQAENGEEAIQQCAMLSPDVILLDLLMPGMDGVSATRMIRQNYPGVQVVALTSFEDKDLVQKAVRAGAISFMLKNSSMEAITETIRAAAAGRSTLSPAIMQSLVETDQLPAEELSQREHEILVLMADGLKNAYIAQQLTISEATVRFHAGNILRKLRAANRAQAVRIALDRRLIS